MKCTVCSHKFHNEIDAALIAEGATIRGVSKKFKVGEDSLTRHLKNGHVSKKIQKTVKGKETNEAVSFFEHIKNRRRRFTQMANEARVNKDPILELKVYATESKFTEMEGRILGSFNDKLKVTETLTVSALPDEEIEKRARAIFAKRVGH